MTIENYIEIKNQLIDKSLKELFENRIIQDSVYTEIDKKFIDAIHWYAAEAVIFNKARQIGFSTMLLSYAFANSDKKFLYLTNKLHPIFNIKGRLYNTPYIQSLSRIDNVVGNITFITPTIENCKQIIYDFEGVVIIDEIAFIKDAFLKELFIHDYSGKPMGISMKSNQFIIGSTPDKSEGFFYELYMGMNTTNFQNRGYNIKELNLTFKDEFLKSEIERLNNNDVFNQYYKHTFLPQKKNKDKILSFRLDEDINRKLESKLQELSFYRGKTVELSEYVRRLIIKDLDEQKKDTLEIINNVERTKQLMSRNLSSKQQSSDVKINAEELFKTLFGQDVKIIRKK